MEAGEEAEVRAYFELVHCYPEVALIYARKLLPWGGSQLRSIYRGADD